MRFPVLAAVSRRTFLALPGSLCLLALRRAEAAPPTIGLSEFLALSTRLTGKSGLDPAVAGLYLNALAADPHKRARLADLAHGRRSHSDLEREIILSWYTGLYQSGRDLRVAAYRQALVWKASGISTPGTCAGPFGFWSRPPAEAGS